MHANGTATLHLMDRRMRELHQEWQQMIHARRLLRPASPEDRTVVTARPPTGHPAGREPLPGLIDDFAFFARTEVLSASAGLRAEDIEHVRPLLARCLRRGVQVRTVVPRDTLADPTVLAYLRELRSLGAEVRVSDALPRQMLVYDRRTAVLRALPGGQDPDGTLLAHEQKLISSLVTLFERMWDQATELPPPTTATGRAPRLSETEKLVLSAMCSAAKDQAAARELGMSLRTYRRHIARIKRLLGAANRPQAALAAREHGWI